jgi:hypothetical protein
MMTLREALKVACLAALLAIMGVVLWHLPGWCRVVDATLVHVDQFAGRGARAMGKLEQASDKSNEASAETLRRIREFEQPIRSLNRTIDDLGALTRNADASITAMRTESEPLFRSANTLLTTADAQLTHVAPLLDSWTVAGQDVHTRLADPNLAASIANFRRVSGAWAGISEDSERKWHSWLYPPPPKTKLGHVWRGINTGVRLALPGAQLGYYVNGVR